MATLLVRVSYFQTFTTKYKQDTILEYDPILDGDYFDVLDLFYIEKVKLIN